MKRDRGGMNSDWRGILQVIRLQREILRRLDERQESKPNKACKTRSKR